MVVVIVVVVVVVVVVAAAAAVYGFRARQDIIIAATLQCIRIGC